MPRRSVQCIFLMLVVCSLVSWILLGWFLADCSFLTNSENTENVNQASGRNIYLQWSCSDGVCRKSQSNAANITEPLSLETCRKTCTDHPVWPQPKTLTLINKTYTQFLKSNIRFNVESPPQTSKALHNFVEIFKGYLKRDDSTTQGKSLNVNIIVQDSADALKLEFGTDESYNLTIKLNGNIDVQIISSNYFGARHALESLSQLIWFDPGDRGYQILHDVVIQDKPSFTYRGVMVDTARNFFPIYLLRKVVDGMSYSKLNVLHLHLTDSVSFPMVFKDLDWLSKGGAYDPNSTYTEEDIQDLREYSLLRGVRLLLEIDAPSHVSAGWHSDSEDTNLVICDEDDVLNGHLNPDNDKSLKVVHGIYTNLLKLMKNDDAFHIGGDEVNLTCWQNSKSAKNFSDITTLWANYTNRMINELKSANKDKLPDNIILWSSPLTNSYYDMNYLKDKENIIVQFWFGDPTNFLALGYRVIFSTVGHWYLDCGFGPWKPSQQNGVCDPYTSWQKFYSYRPWTSSLTESLTEGGEVCLWSEQVAEESLETRIWPRAAAFAERIWSDPIDYEKSVYVRLDNLREIMRARGLQVSAIWPKWCSMNPGSC